MANNLLLQRGIAETWFVPGTRYENEEEDILTNTRLFTALTEELIRKHPDQRVWMHERWKTKKGKCEK